MSYNLKPALTIDEQVNLLKSRGMIIEDDAEASRILSRVNYYRLTGFAFLFQKSNDKYSKGTSLSHIIKLMEFDSELRQLLMRQLEFIEIYARTQIAHWFSLAHDRDGGAHYNPSLFVEEEFHKNYIDNLNAQIDNNRDQPFVRHHIDSFNGRMPLWSAVEILSFSMLSKLYSNMLPDDKNLISANMNTDSAHLVNWLHCFSVLRNACAHYNRLYKIIYSPKASLDGSLLRKHQDIMQDTLFAYVIAMLRIIPDESRKSDFVKDLESLIVSYDGTIELSGIGFPDKWLDILSDKSIIFLKPVSEEKKKLDL